MRPSRKQRNASFEFFRLGGYLLPAAAVLWVLSCSNDINDGTPLGPAFSTIQVFPASGQVQKLGTLTFTAKGGITPFSWSIATTTVGTIDAATGVFTAANTAGTATVTATDATGSTGTGTVTVLANTTIGVSPSSSIVAVGGTLTFTAVGGTAPFFWTTTGTAVGTIDLNTGVFSAVAAGTETISVVDSLGNTGSTSVTVQ
ncbi:MAG: Ig-like domain-containing protein [Nitrospinaceae bacterium]